MDDNQGDALSIEYIQRAGDRELMERVYNLHGDYLMKNISRQLHVLPDDDESRDCFNFVFLKLSEKGCRKVRLFQGRASFKTYLVTVCRNLIVDYYRENSSFAEVEYMEPDKLIMTPDTHRGRELTPENSMIEKEKSEKMAMIMEEAKQKMKELNDHERMVIGLKSMKRTYDEINRMTGDKNSAYTLKCAYDKIKNLMGEEIRLLFLTLIEE